METENLNTKIAHNTPIPTEVAALEYWKFAIEKNRTQLIDAGGLCSTQYATQKLV